MIIPANQLQRAIDIYLEHAYAGVAIPPPVLERAAAIRSLPADTSVAEDLLEPHPGNCGAAYAVRLGQPLYPHMKLVIEPVPGNTSQAFLFRTDAHDRHLHAPPGSPDAQWLAAIRASNQALVDKIESAWALVGLPTFKEFLRQQLAQRRNKT